MLLAASPAALAAPALPSTNIAWLAAAADADIERAFAQARREGKPLLLYWGATWCPPCNQLKATLFNRAEFAALAASFVAVHIDGDRPGAQKLGQRFQASGYPTLLLLRADGTEITRLPSGAEPERVLELMQLAMAGGRPAKAVLADVTAGRKISPAEWRLLAFYSWSTDEAQLVKRAELPGLLATLSQASQGAGSGATPEVATRLWLRALAASDDGKGLKPDAAQRERLRKLLAEPAALRSLHDLVLGYADDVVRALAPEAGAERDALRSAYGPVLERAQADGTLSRGDRMTALLARVELARLDLNADDKRPVLPAALLADVRSHVERADREITSGYERQAVITLAAHVLGRAGLWSDSDALLKANLTRSHAAYYLMSQLGSNARSQGRPAEAVDWYAQAWEKSEGPATRLQWGTGYLSALVELAPREVARIEKAAAQIFQEALQDPGAFDGRSARGMQRVSARLLTWNADGRNAAVVHRLRLQLDGLCKKVDAGEARSACDGLLVAPKAAAAKG